MNREPSGDFLQSFLSKLCGYRFYENKYSSVDVKKIKSITELPVLEKYELRALRPSDMITVEKKKLFEYHESFGTTGVPVSTWFTENDFAAYVDQIEESSVNIGDDDIVMIRFPYAISVPAHIFTQMARKRRACVVPISRASIISPHPRVIEMLFKTETTVLCCIPYEAFLLAGVAKKIGKDLRKLKNLRALCVAGEMLSPYRKKRLEKLWNVPVYEFYGSTETGNLATTCSAGNFHCSEDHYYFEVLLARDKSLSNYLEKNNLGILHVTTKSKENFPLIRYNLEDVVMINNAKCSCGSAKPQLVHHGRLKDLINVKKSWMTIRSIQDSFLRFPENLVGNFWSLRVTEEFLEINIESELYRDVDARDYLTKSIKMEIPFQLNLVPENTIVNIDQYLEIQPLGKPRYVVGNGENDEVKCN